MSDAEFGSRTRLFDEKEGFECKLWVEIEGRELQVYKQNVAADGVLEAWIPSEEGRIYEIHCNMKDTSATPSSYPDLRVQCKVDGTQIKKFAWTSDMLRTEDAVNGRAYYTRISADEVQKLVFSKPVLTEDETSETVSVDRLGTIEVCFRRCIKDVVNTEVSGIDKGKRSAIEISETSKKGSLVGSITAFTEPEVRKRTHSSHVKAYHPEDKDNDYFSVRLRYAPRDYLQARGYMPLDINLTPGEAGSGQDHPIAIEDDVQPSGDVQPADPVVADSPRPVSTRRVRVKSEVPAEPVANGTAVEESSNSVRVKPEAQIETEERRRAIGEFRNAVKVKAETAAESSSGRGRIAVVENGARVKSEDLARLDGDQAAIIARRIAETRRELEALEEQHRRSLTAKEPHPRSEDEEDSKENIHRRMAKKLKMAKERDNGFVDLTFDDD